MARRTAPLETIPVTPAGSMLRYPHGTVQRRPAEDFFETLTISRVEKRSYSKKVCVELLDSMGRLYYMDLDKFNELLRREIISGSSVTGTWRYVQRYGNYGIIYV